MARIRPERRTPVDLAVSAAIVVVLLTVGVLVWAHSPVRHSESVQAAGPVPAVTPSTTVPDRVTPLWRAHSSATRAPAIARSLVVTADGGTVIGRDPATGTQVWRYQRDLPLCGIIAAWPASADEVLTAYRNSRGCGEITALDGTTGARKGARSSDADDRIQLSSDSGYVVAQGDTRLETWGSNLVRGIEYGRVATPVKPEVQPDRHGCRLFSSIIGGDRIAVIEHCTDDPGYRLTVLGAVLDKDEKVQQHGSTVITAGTSGPPPVVIAMNTSAITVYDGGANPPAQASGTPAAGVPASIRLFTTDGTPSATNPTDGAQAAPTGSVPIVSTGVTSYFTGRATVVLNSSTGRPMYQVPGAIGAGDIMGGYLLLPTATGISVLDAANGREIRSIAVRRDGRVDQPVNLRVLGTTIVEQWGDTVAAYGPA
ncbi:Rv3212 family protein [Gordonia sp. NPDC003424]